MLFDNVLTMHLTYRFSSQSSFDSATGTVVSIAGVALDGRRRTSSQCPNFQPNKCGPSQPLDYSNQSMENIIRRVRTPSAVALIPVVILSLFQLSQAVVIAPTLLGLEDFLSDNHLIYLQQKLCSALASEIMIDYGQQRLAKNCFRLLPRADVPYGSGHKLYIKADSYLLCNSLPYERVDQVVYSASIF